MKVITIQQPWASLIVLGAKKIETRSWATRYRGPILIHASAAMPKLNRELCATEAFATYLSNAGPLPLGAIIGRAVLRMVYPTDHLLSCFRFSPSSYCPHEVNFGDYSAGRYGWCLEDVVRFETPIPAKGQLGLWEFPNDLLPKQTHRVMRGL